MGQYLWENKGWTDFRWDSRAIAVPLGQARRAQGEVLGQAKILGLETQAEFVTEEAVQTSAIEGETVDRRSVRSSVANRLGLPSGGLPPPTRPVDGLVAMLLDATTNTNELTKERVDGWHAALFPTGYNANLQKLIVGNWRNDAAGPMQVVSKEKKREIIHYEAPPADRLKSEFSQFKSWWDNPPEDLDGIVRAAIVHLWFVSIHPYEDGNGRISRALTDMALAQDDGSKYRLYSMSAQIIKERDEYYKILEETQKGDGTITQWVVFFLGAFTRSLESSKVTIEKALSATRFWSRIPQTSLNERQIKVLRKLAGGDFQEGMSNKKYLSLTGTSAATAKRDLGELVDKGILRMDGKGRGVRYHLIGEE